MTAERGSLASCDCFPGRFFFWAVLSLWNRTSINDGSSMNPPVIMNTINYILKRSAITGKASKNRDVVPSGLIRAAIYPHSSEQGILGGFRKTGQRNQRFTETHQMRDA